MKASPWPYLALGLGASLPALLLAAPWRLPLALTAGTLCGLLAWRLAGGRPSLPPASTETTATPEDSSPSVPPPQTLASLRRGVHSLREALPGAVAPPATLPAALPLLSGLPQRRQRERQELLALAAALAELQSCARQFGERVSGWPEASLALSQTANDAAGKSDYAVLAASAAEQAVAPLVESLPAAQLAVDSCHQRASELLQQGEEALRLNRSSLEEMEQAEAAGQRAAEAAGQLQEQVREIGVIAELIRELVSDTELLAFNAAIIAARAGEQGQAFAVVADEVRELADRTTGSAGEIQRLLEDLGRGTGTLQGALDTLNRRIGLGLHHAGNSGQQLRQQLQQAEGIRETLGDWCERNRRHVEQATGLQQQAQAIHRQLEGLAHLLRDQRAATDRWRRTATLPEPALRFEQQLTETRHRLEQWLEQQAAALEEAQQLAALAPTMEELAVELTQGQSRHLSLLDASRQLEQALAALGD